MVLGHKNGGPRDSNSQPSDLESDALPLRHSPLEGHCVLGSEDIAGVANLRAVGSLKTECCLGWIGPFLPTRQEEDTRCKPIPVLSLSRLNPEPPKRTGPSELLGRSQRKNMKMPPLRESCKKQVIPWERLALPQQPKLYLGPKWLG